MGKILRARTLAAAPLAARAAAFVLTCAVATAVAEWSVRLAVPEYDPAGQITWEMHPVAGTVLGRPDSYARQIKNSGDYDVSVSFNRHGFRDRQDVSTGTREDIYVVGDSFAFGWGVEAQERFSNQLAGLLGRRVFNITASANLDGYEKLLAYAEKLGAKIEHVVLALNMIDDIGAYAPPRKQAGKSAQGSGFHSLMAIKVFLLRESALYFLVTQTLNDVGWLRRALVRVGLIRTIEQVSGGAPGNDAVAATASRLAELDKAYDLTVMLIPSRGLWLGERRGETLESHRRVKAALEDRGIRVVDPKPQLESSGNPLRYHFRNDGHWNPEGHKVVARALRDALAEGKE